MSEHDEYDDVDEEETEEEDMFDGISPSMDDILALASFVIPKNSSGDQILKIAERGLSFYERSKREKAMERERLLRAKKKAIQEERKAKQEREKAETEKVLIKEKAAILAEQRKSIELENEKKRLAIENLKKQIEMPTQLPQTHQFQPQVLYGELPSIPHTPALECADNPEEFKAFLDYIASNPTSILILGSKGQGKSALGHAFLEYIHARTGKPAVILGAPKEKSRLFPNWVRIVEDWNEVPEGSIVLVDEAGIVLFSRNSMSKANKTFAEINAISRQKNLTLIYTSQSSRSVDVNTIYAGETQVIFKKPDQFAIEFERNEIKKLARDALDLLSSHVEDKAMLKEFSVVYFFSGEGKFLMRNGLASYWSEDLSKLFSGVPIKNREQEIKVLHSQGLSQQAIAQRLSITQGYVSRILNEK